MKILVFDTVQADMAKVSPYMDTLWLVIGDITVIPSSSWSVLGDARRADVYICHPSNWPIKEAVGKPAIMFREILQNGLIPSVVTIDGEKYQVTYANLYPRQK